MRDELYLSGVLSPSAIAAAEALSSSPEASFSDQVRLMGLNPKSDLRYADLNGVDLSGSDIRGYDFTGADLRHVFGVKVKWDSSTRLEGADLSGSLFASQLGLAAILQANEKARNLLKSVSGQTWADQIVWAHNNLRPSGRHHDLAIPILEALFYRAQDTFLRSQLLRLIAPRISSLRERKEFLLSALVNYDGDTTTALSVLSATRVKGLANDPAIKGAIRRLAEAPDQTIRSEALRWLVRHLRTAEEMEWTRTQLLKEEPHLSGYYVAHVTRRLGDQYDLVTRDPIDNSSFGIQTNVPLQKLDLIARRWLRAEKSKDQHRPLIERRDFSPLGRADDIGPRVLEILELWRELERYGIHIRAVPETGYPAINASSINV